jgi:hypothetical protein
MKSFAPVRPLRPAWQFAVAATALTAGFAVLGIRLLGWAPPVSLGPLSLALLGVLFLATIGGAAWAAAQWMSPTGRASLVWPLATGSLLLFWLLAAGVSEPFVPLYAGLCFTVGSVVALLTGVLLLALFRRAAPLLRHRVSLAAGALAGLAGFLSIQAHCPIEERLHILVGHGLLPVVWALAGWLLARLALR